MKRGLRSEWTLSRMNDDILILALGSNLGDRESYIRQAVAHLERRFGPVVRISPMLETQAIGFEGPAFLDALAVFHCTEDPLTVLGICKETERHMGRTDAPEYDSDGRRIYHDRIIDIDILLYGERKVGTPVLTIPHPALKTRPFIGELLLTLRPL